MRYERHTPFASVCRKLMEGLNFHDLRHHFVTKVRRAGVDMLTIMKISGHKTTAVFKRYNLIDENDLHVAQGRIVGYEVGTKGGIV